MLWIDQDLNAGPKLRAELREDSVRFVDPRGGGVESVTLFPESYEEAVLMAIALRKAYKRLEELATGLPRRRERA